MPMNNKCTFALQKKMRSKIEEILAGPHHYKTLRNVLKNKRRVHIGSFVLIFEVNETAKTVIFNRLKHHDEVYKE